MSNVAYFDFLRERIEDYRRLEKAHPDALRPEDWLNQAEFRSAKAGLAQATDRSQENPIIGVYLWWNVRTGAMASEVQRLRHTWLLLRALDDAYSDRRLCYAQGVLLGKRWWNIATRCDRQRGKSGILDGAERTKGYEFPHLRLYTFRKNEWFPGSHTRGAFSHVSRNCALRFGLCSLGGRAHTFFRGTRPLPLEHQSFGFLATDIRWQTPAESPSKTTTDPRQPTEYYDELHQSVKWAREEGINVLCFPELCVCPDGREVLRNEIQSDPGQLCLVVPGSYHCGSTDQADVPVNTAPIWLVGEGKIQPIPEYEKVNPMGMEISAKVRCLASLRSPVELADIHQCTWIKEDIRPGGSLRLLDTPFGVIGLAICKDILWNERSVVHHYADLADHLLVISMNRAANRFLPEAQKFADLGTAVYFVNTPQVVESGNADTEIVFWYMPPVEKALNVRTRVCYYLAGPVGDTAMGKREHILPEGRVSCSLDFAEPSFAELFADL